jgi:hypothetical protein
VPIADIRRHHMPLAPHLVDLENAIDDAAQGGPKASVLVRQGATGAWAAGVGAPPIARRSHLWDSDLRYL